jgi:hypothetical protein
MIGVINNINGILRNIPIKKWSDRNKKYSSGKLQNVIIELLTILSGLKKNFRPF